MIDISTHESVEISIPKYLSSITRWRPLPAIYYLERKSYLLWRKPVPLATLWFVSDVESSLKDTLHFLPITSIDIINLRSIVHFIDME